MNELKISQSDAKTPDEFDALLRAHADIKQLDVKLEAGVYHTMGTRGWADTNDVQLNPGFRLGPQWTVDGANKATVKLSPSSIPPEQRDSVPLVLLYSTELRLDKERVNLHTPEEAYAALPDGQAVRNLKVDLSYAEAAALWKAAGQTLLVQGVALAGRRAAIERVDVVDYGALGVENFPLYIQTAYGMYDRNLIARTDPATHIIDSEYPDKECSHITDCTLDGYAAGISDKQVSCAFIAGNVGQLESGEWVQHMRAYAYATGNSATIPDENNMVQLITLYQVLRGLAEHNSSDGLVAGYYGDSYKTRGVKIRFNKFRRAYHAIQIQLSPEGADAENFSAEAFEIGPNECDSRAENVQLNMAGPKTATRYIKDFKIDAALSVKVDEQVKGDVTYIRTGALATPKGGCGRHLPFRR